MDLKTIATRLNTLQSETRDLRDILKKHWSWHVLASEGFKMEAIVKLREESGISLMQAKTIVENYLIDTTGKAY